MFDLAVLMESPSQPLRFAAADPARSRAQERRARKRRAEARVRLRLAADHKLLTEHHASQPPATQASAFGSTKKIELLLEAMLAQQQALFMCISGLYGWQTGWHSGSPSDLGASEPVPGTAAGGTVDVPSSSVQFGAGAKAVSQVQEGHIG